MGARVAFTRRGALYGTRMLPFRPSRAATVHASSRWNTVAFSLFFFGSSFGFVGFVLWQAVGEVVRACVCVLRLGGVGRGGDGGPVDLGSLGAHFFFFFKLSLPSYATAILSQRSERLVHRRRVFSHQAATITLHGAQHSPPPVVMWVVLRCDRGRCVILRIARCRFCVTARRPRTPMRGR